VATLSYAFEGDTLGLAPTDWPFYYESDPAASANVATGGIHPGTGNYWWMYGGGGVYQEHINTNPAMSAADVVIEGLVWTNGTAPRSWFFLRHDGAAFASQTCYWVLLGGATPTIYKLVSGSSTLLATGAAKTFSKSTEYHFKIEAAGTTIRAKWWTGAEPGTWDVSVVDAAISAAGTVGLGSVEEAKFDDLEITSSDIVTDVAVTQDPVGTLAVTGYDPVILQGAQYPLGTLAVTGYDPVVFTGINVIPARAPGLNAGELKIVSYNPLIAAQPINVYPGLGALSITGYDPVVLAVAAVDQDPVGSVSITGYNPVVAIQNIPSPVGSIVITGFNPTVAAESSNVHLYIKFKDAYGTVWTREIDSKPTVTEVATTYIADSIDEIILADATSAAFNVTLPTPTGRSGFIYTVKKIDSSANAVTVVGTIDGDANFDLELEDESVTITSDGTEWWII